MRRILLAPLLLALTLGAARAAESPATRAFVGPGDTWRYATGDAPPPATWRDEGFDDASWREGASGFGYGDEDDATVLQDMKGRYVSVFLRRAFTATAEDAMLPLKLVVRSDDGFVAWLNGAEIARARLDGEPPAADALAKDHEASAPEEFAVPAGLLREGRNVLCVQAHNASLDSSDFTIEPQLLSAFAVPAAAPAAPSGPAPRAARRHPFSITAATYRVGNYFQGRAGSPKEAVNGQLVRGEWRIAPRGSRVRLTLRGEVNRVGDLGTTPSLFVRAAWPLGRHELRVEADAQWDRPAFRFEGSLAPGDTAGLQVGWAWKAPRDMTVAAWIDGQRERLEKDPRRDNENLMLGASVRYLRSKRAFSPEIGLEASRRRAGAPAFEYDERRIFVRVRSRLLDRVELSGLLRYGRREYMTAREDRRRLARLSCDVDLVKGLTLVTFMSWEDGMSSTDARAFEDTTLWGGLRWTP